MGPKRHHILVTKELSDEDIRFAEKLGFNVEIEPVLAFEFIDVLSQFLEILDSEPIDALVFTSRNGVLGFLKLIAGTKVDLKKLKCYVVGKKTASELENHGFDITTPEESNAVGLADLIKAEPGIRSVIHFCGDRRRKELSEILNRAGIRVNELIVYRTVPNQKTRQETIAEAVLFYSPSGVEAFLESHKEEVLNMPVFAIGSTTAATMRNSGFKRIFVADETSTVSLLNKVNEFFNGNL